MMLARLDNEVFFKKAFTDKLVLKAFVKDIVGIDINPDRIETEKTFAPRLGNIGFRYDIFAEDFQKRVIVEIQKVEYDHNFDRFLHYHLQAIAEQQRHSEDYTIGKTVYTIVVMTAPYRINEKTREIYRDEVLVSALNPRNLKGVERKIFNHELVFLNPNYKGDDTPANYRDWLDLIYESIHHPENPHLNTANVGVMRASELIEQNNISPEEWEAAKFKASSKKVVELAHEEGKAEGLAEGKAEQQLAIARKMLALGLPNALIAEATGLAIGQIEQLRNNTSS